MKTALGFLLILLFLSPLLILVGAGVVPSQVFAQSTLSVFGFTILQAALSAISALVLGLFGAYGLEAAAKRWGAANGKFLEVLSLLPNVAPVLLFLLAVMKFAPGLRGLTGIVVVHALLNAGLVSASILRLFRSKIAGLADLAWVEGVSRTGFFVRVVIPVLFSDLLMIFTFVFAICFTSLAVPLVIGGSRATTLETLIWQWLRIDGDFSRALGATLLQIVAIVFLTFVLRRRTFKAQSTLSRTVQPLLANGWGLPFILAPSVLLTVSMFDRPWRGASMFLSSEVLLSELMRTFAGSFLVAIGTGCFVALLLLVLAFVEPKGVWQKLLLGYVAPSSAITGFAILIAWRSIGPGTYMKITLAITLISVPAFYRLYWDATLSSLANQRAVASTLGASAWLTFRRVVLPQIVKPASFVAGLSSLWAWGDFALSKTIAERDVTLGMMVQSLMGSYRFEIATFLVWILLFGGALTFFISKELAVSWVKNLRADYGNFRVEIPDWEILDEGVTALWGPSGSGKTSVFRLLLGLDKPVSSFSWDFRGVDLAKLSTPERTLGVVFQSLELFPHMTAEENILFASDARKIPAADAKAHLKSLVETLQLSEALGRSASLLSGGERQRVALARALIGRPRILLLDEPFSALDADLRAEARELVRSAIAREKIPTVLITHDRSDLDALATKITEIRGGRLWPQ